MLGQLLEFVRTAIQETILTLGYAGIALVMFAENVFPPIPSELVMPFAGWLARDGKMDLVASIFAGTAHFGSLRNTAAPSCFSGA